MASTLTLDRWREFLTAPKTLILPRMELIGFDHAPPIVAGKGEIQMNSTNEFSFSLSGTPSDISYALREIRRQRENIYDANARFRLIGTDDKGINWMGGWTLASVDSSRDQWKFTGDLQVLSTQDQGEAVSHEAGAELIFLLRVGDPMAIHLARYVCSDVPGESRLYEFEALGSQIRFAYERAGTLLVTATKSSDFGPPYAENWLAEPLRILFGQPIYPRLVSRNFGDGRAFVSVRPSPPIIQSARWLALWQMRDEMARDNAAFWSTYAGLLSLIARFRDKRGDPNFEAHKLTRLYDECISASRVTRWVLALTIASTIEAVGKLLDKQRGGPTKVETRSPSINAGAIASLVSHINAWKGDESVKKIAIEALTSPPARGARRILRESGVVTPDQLAAWMEIRHSVMHGGLISPYSTKEEDEKLMLLADMLHALTRELARTVNG